MNILISLGIGFVLGKFLTTARLATIKNWIKSHLGGK